VGLDPRLVDAHGRLRRTPDDVAAGGLHEVDGRRIYVSRGVGVERGQGPRLRMGAVPEVSLITLR